IGFFVFTVQLSHSSLASGQADFFWPLIWRGFGMGLLYVPLTTLALSDLRGKDIHQGTGFTNMMRQLGGSFGVALMATYVQHRAWFHRQDLLTHVTAYDAPVRERLAMMTEGFMRSGSSPVEAARRAYQA